MTEIEVNASQRCTVHIGAGLLPETGRLLAGVVDPCRAMLVSDDTVFPLYGARVRDSLAGAGFAVSEFVFPAGERSKNLATFGQLLEALGAAGFARSDVVVALGGGVVGDLAGFAGACYQRGIRVVQVPTTLLAAVDSSVGGKTGVDLASGKNQAGAFHQPCLVVCDTQSFHTLDETNFACGCAEAIKCGILAAPDLFEIFECGQARERIDEIVAHCVKIKADFVARDEFDTGDRRFLNLGHTFGHAVEALSGYETPHGCAVAIGTALIADASVKAGALRPETAARIRETLRRNGLPVACPYDAQALAAAAASDKKISGGTISVVLIRDVGDCFLQPVKLTELGKLL